MRTIGREVERAEREGEAGRGIVGRVYESSWSERADGRTDANAEISSGDRWINGCVQLVAGKIDDEHTGGLYPTSLAGESRRAAEARTRRSAPRRAARGEDGAKTEISIFRPLRFVRCSYLPRAPSCPRQAPFKTPTTRASYAALVHAASSPSTLPLPSLFPRSSDLSSCEATRLE